MIPSFTEWSNAFTHATLAAAALWSYQYFGDSIAFLRVAANLHLILGVIGLLAFLVARYGTADQLDHVTAWYATLLEINCLLVLPCCVAQAYQTYRYVFELAAAHVVLGVVPFLNRSARYRESYTVANLCSLAYLGHRHRNYYALSVVPLCALNLFVVGHCETVLRMSAQDVFVLLLAVTHYFAIKVMTSCAS